MATAPLAQREQQLDLYPRPVPSFVPHFEQLDRPWTWQRIAALTGFSLLIHLAFALIVVALILALPKNSPIVLTAHQLIDTDKSVQYMDLAPDKQKPLEKPKTNVISDKDPPAATRTPPIDRKPLARLADNRRPGAPAPAAPPVPAASAQQPQQQAQSAPPQQSGPAPQPSGQQVAQLHSPGFPGGGQTQPSFGGPSRAGSVIQQAARAASEQRGSEGMGGDFGSGPAVANTNHRDDLEILSDPLGVDFAPYLRRMRIQVGTNWENVMPESVFPPLRKRGTVIIEFSVLKDGTVAGLKLVGSSGDIALDRAAYAAISASNPMAPLPTDFRGDYFTVRARFYYNPGKNEMQ